MVEPPRTAAGPDREVLGFLDAARRRFRFLVDDGFEEVSAAATYLRLERRARFVEVFHGRRSYEIGAVLGRWIEIAGAHVEQKFALAEVAPVIAPEVAVAPRTATSPAQVVQFVDELAEVAHVLLGRVDELERDGVEVFELVSEGVALRSSEYVEGMRAERLRARADEAWHHRDLAVVVAAYEEIDAELGTVRLRGSELGRLAYARRHLRR